VGFLAPWFLGSLAVVGLPIWLHLLKRHRTKPLPFSSLMFFERRIQSSIKHRRLRYLLLFALRTALLVLLVVAFAHPFVNSSGGATAGGRKIVVLAIDNSFSMRHGDRLERAKREAMQVLRSGERAQVLAFGSQVRMMSDLTTDGSALRSAIRAVEASDSRSSYAELSRALRSIAQSARMPVEAHLFSDMQKSSLPASFRDLRLAEGIRLVPHALAGRREPNFTVENVNAPRRIYDPKKVRIQATIAGFGAERASRRVSLLLNGRELDSKTIEVPAGGRAAVEFLSLDAPYGLNRGEIRIDSGDALPADDRFFFSVERSDPRRVLFVHEGRNTRDLLYFRTALESSADAAFQLDAVPAEQAAGMTPSQYAFVVVSDVASLPGAFEEKLKDSLRGGGAVLIALGRTSAVHSKVPLFEESIVEARYAPREGERFQTVAYLDPAHPSIRRANRWEGVKFYQAIRVQPGKSRIAARLSDETPLLMEKQIGEGRVLVFASTFDNIANDFPLHASFVPFVEQTASYLAGLDDSQSNFMVGSYLELRAARERRATIEVLGPKGERELSLEEATRARNLQLTQAGFYEVRRPSGRHELVAVNADRHESDLDLIPPETLALWQNTGQGSRAASGGGPDGDGRKPKEFWWYIMTAVLLLALAESLVGNRHLSVEKEAA
jgi:hypothetical protein